jgi:hypothetical protein
MISTQPLIDLDASQKKLHPKLFPGAGKRTSENLSASDGVFIPTKISIAQKV